MKRILMVAAVLVAALLMPLAAHGQKQNGQFGLKIAPTTYEATITPGQPKDGVVDVFNISPGPVTVEPKAENIRMVGEAGDLEFFIGSNPFRLDPYIQLDRSAFTLGKGEARRVPFRITLPVGSPPGSYLGAVLFKTAPELGAKSGAVVKQSGQVGTLLILTAPGQADRKGAIQQVKVSHPDIQTTVSTGITYANTGNTDKTPLGVAYKPKGTVTIKNLFGRTVAKHDVAAPVIFPGAKRTFAVKTKKDFWFGPYTATVTMSPGEGATSSQKVMFWAISWPSVLVVLGIIGLIAAYVGLKKRKKL